MTKVLIVDDDPFMSSMYSTVFGLEQFEVVVAIDGVDGLQKARDTKPDIILLDIMMPRMNGVEMLEKLKADDALRGIPVLILTNLADAEQKKSMLEMGALKYLIKSEYNPKQVVEIVRGVLAENAPQKPQN